MFTPLINADKYTRLAIRLHKQGYRMVCSTDPTDTEMQRFGYIRTDYKTGARKHAFLNVRRNGFHNITK